jgi:hypothetical protein
MKKLTVVCIITACITLLSVRCERDGDCKEVITVPYAYLEDFGGTDDCGLDFSVAAADSNYLINNEDYYEELINCQDSILDFTKYVLLAGSRQFDTTVVKKSQAAIRNCKDRTFTYRISFEVTDTVDTRFHQYHAIIPKIPDDYQITFEIVLWRDY